ncbi:protein TIFY 10a [Cucumis melo var. makuwa]|nr:protein TIFY 10a [Cucumis melo var. makuwa]
MADRKSLDLFPQEAGFGNSNDVDSRVYKSATAGPQTSQMTIFYAGQVFVFNNFPADRVGDVMFLASQESSRLNIPTTASVAARQPPILVGTPADSLSSTSPVSTRNQTSPPPPPPPPSVPGALPMARKASIQRFLEKRKDRLTPRAPYHNSSPMTSKNSGENSWLGLAVQSQN